VSFAIVSQKVCALRYQGSLEGKVPSDIGAIDSACENPSINHSGVYPSDLEPILMTDPETIGYLRSTSLPRDPWGREYLYAPPDAHCHHPRVWTLGRDGLPGGEGLDADADKRAVRFDLSPPWSRPSHLPRARSPITRALPLPCAG
jgi:hypothetical protein